MFEESETLKCTIGPSGDVPVDCGSEDLPALPDPAEVAYSFNTKVCTVSLPVKTLQIQH